MLERGDIVFVMHNDNVISKIIAWFMKSRWSHSAVVVDVTPFRTYLCETSDFQVMIGTYDRYVHDAQTSIEVWRSERKISDKDMKVMLENAVDAEGTTYGYLQLFSFGLRRMLMRFNIKIPNFIRQGMVCCAVPLRAYTMSPIVEFNGIDPESIDTQEMYDIISTSGKFKRVFSR